MDETGILSIAALDTSGGAGINQDIRVAALHGEQICACLSGISIQTANGVEAIYPVSEKAFSHQLTRMLQTRKIKYIKIGALCSVWQISVICDKLSRPNEYTIVLDPVFAPTRGMEFIRKDQISHYRQLLELADYICPNLTELSILSKMQITSPETALEASKYLCAEFSTGVLQKGGHFASEQITETFVSKNITHTFQKERKHWTYSHGTGCALSMVFTCHLKKGHPAEKAFEKASNWVGDWYDELNK